MLCLLNGKYRVIKELGRGGMSTVYLCLDIFNNKRVTIKVTSKEMETNALREAGILSCLNHPGIPEFLEAFQDKDNIYLVTEYLEGLTLYEYARSKKRLKVAEILDIGCKLCDVLIYLHDEAGIIHRDIKPDNILINSGRISLIDFGIAKPVEDFREKTIAYGTMGYAAPELVSKPQKTDKRSDIYSLGVTLLYLYTGIEPKGWGFDVNKYIFNNRNNPIQYKAFLRVLGKNLAKNPKKRYRDFVKLKKDLIKFRAFLRFEKNIVNYVLYFLNVGFLAPILVLIFCLAFG